LNPTWNVTLTSVSVAWSHDHYTCPNEFYGVIYWPSWNRILSGVLRHDFLTLQRLTPSTNYILCCTNFHTMARDAVFPASKMIDLAMVIWLISSVLFIILAMVLLYGCLRMWCKKCKNTSNGPGTSEHISGHAGNAHSWHGVDIETTQIHEFPTLIVTDMFPEIKPERVIHTPLGGTMALLSHRQEAHKL
uniref:Fibronectin type-III domain-containing protein n=1 Tax=Chelydra serpentina TaxID=8475 RepID=A0A8C3XV18_CHESE